MESIHASKQPTHPQYAAEIQSVSEAEQKLMQLWQDVVTLNTHCNVS